MILQIPQHPHRFHDVKVTVRIHEYPDGTLAVFHGPRCLARYHVDGRLIETEVEARHRKNPTPRSNDHPIVDPRATGGAIISARGGKTRPEEPDRSWATYTGQVNLLSIGEGLK